ncbi:MAG TPA: dephospho-CoA kinase [Solirubrobacteraceae bacterium]|nr:dephospho-CoA kinase [Solirubrobacteraceae bacterium]
MPAPPFVGLTGGIGAGKSEALAALARLGAVTISTDGVVHELYADPQIRSAVVARWGEEVAPDGTVDRAVIAGRAFADADERAWLEGIMWPKVGERIAEWRAAESQRRPAPPALVVETPLLFEAGLESAYDVTIAVVADEEVRARRAAERGHEAVDERTARQLTQEQKAQRATFAIENSGSIEELESKLSAVLDKLKA